MSLALLLTPGPTNTLLLVGGAMNGLISLGEGVRSGRILAIEPNIVRRLGSAVLILFAVVIGYPLG